MVIELIKLSIISQVICQQSIKLEILATGVAVDVDSLAVIRLMRKVGQVCLLLFTPA